VTVEGCARRRLLLHLLCAPALAGCELRPLYGGAEGGQMAAELAAIAIDTPKTRVGWLLRDRLIDELGADGTADPRYRLSIRLSKRREALAIQLDDSVTRYELALIARFSLEDIAARRPLYRGRVRRVASYNVVRSPFATLVAEQDAERRAAAELAYAIRTRLALFFRGSRP